MKDIIIIGGGLAGLVNAIRLADSGLNVLVIERKKYPFHRVCGEYISNEALPFLKSIGADPEELNPAKIKNLLISSPYGTTLHLPLEMGGFGISRYSLDNYLYSVALAKGASFIFAQASDVKFENEIFNVSLSDGSSHTSKIVIGSYGKRSNLDRQLSRTWFSKKSPYIAVKYHIVTNFPKDLIALHNFKDGYCGISKVEKERHCLCYMTTRENLRESGTIPEMEQNILYKNPFLKNIFENSEFLYDKPEVINEISFERKTSVEQHILMSGDAAGMITPLCGNGMAMAIHSAKILSDLIIKYYKKENFNRVLLEKEYEVQWKTIFAQRLMTGRKIQQLFGRELVTDLSIRLLKRSKSLSKWIVKQTHGSEF